MYTAIPMIDAIAVVPRLRYAIYMYVYIVGTNQCSCGSILFGGKDSEGRTSCRFRCMGMNGVLPEIIRHCCLVSSLPMSQIIGILAQMDDALVLSGETNICLCWKD